MCNLSENIKESGIKEGIKEGIEKGIKKGIREERINAIERMIKAGAVKEQIVSYGYTEEELAEVENILCTNV